MFLIPYEKTNYDKREKRKLLQDHLYPSLWTLLDKLNGKLLFTYVRWWPSRIPPKIENISNLRSLPDLLVKKSAVSK